VNLILFWLQEHYRLADDIREEEANLVFNNVARKVIRDAFKHTHCIYVAFSRR
jgi:hypothetical protein